MRCPKCGAFMEEGKDVCFMCGTNIRTYNPMDNANNTSFNNSDDTSGMFGSGSGSVNKNNNYGYNNQPNSYEQAKENYKNRFNNYREGVNIQPVKNGEHDIFDFFSENKKVIRVVLFLVIAGIIAFAGNAYYKSKTKEKPVVPVLMNLYYEVDESFKLTDQSNNKRVYSKSGATGNDCSIEVTVKTGLSGNHVQDWFKEIKDSKEPEKDLNGEPVRELDIYTPQQGSIDVYEKQWHYLNLFYRLTEKGDPTHLKFRYLSSTYNGYFYDIMLVNISNDALCSASLDNFSKSIKFIEITES